MGIGYFAQAKQNEKFLQFNNGQLFQNFSSFHLHQKIYCFMVTKSCASNSSHHVKWQEMQEEVIGLKMKI
jgi:hypothetical protein